MDVAGAELAGTVSPDTETEQTSRDSTGTSSSEAECKRLADFVLDAWARLCDERHRIRQVSAAALVQFLVERLLCARGLTSGAGRRRLSIKMLRGSQSFWDTSSPSKIG